jgi:sugar (pentulose or hexulose) kinase
LRYLAAGTANFTLLSTGTWIIGFAPNADIFTMQPEWDTLTNTDVFGRPVPSCRFMGGREIELAASGVPASAANFEAALSVIAKGLLALPSFTTSGGPLPKTQGKGRFEGPPAATDAERASLASIYCAQMTVQALDAVGATGDLIVDGPFGKNPIYLSVLAALRQSQPVRVSEIVDGTAAGAALLAEMIDTGKVPNVPLALSSITRGDWPGLDRYHARWIERATM